jgi:hypothetical protein
MGGAGFFGERRGVSPPVPRLYLALNSSISCRHLNLSLAF